MARKKRTLWRILVLIVFLTACAGGRRDRLTAPTDLIARLTADFPPPTAGQVYFSEAEPGHAGYLAPASLGRLYGAAGEGESARESVFRWAVFLSSGASSVWEIHVFEAADQSRVGDLEQLFEGRLGVLRDAGIAAYDPVSGGRAADARIVTVGRRVFLFVTDDNGALEAAVKKWA